MKMRVNVGKPHLAPREGQAPLCRARKVPTDGEFSKPVLRKKRIMIQLRDGRIEDMLRIQEIEQASSRRFARIGMAEIAADAPTSSATLSARIGSRDLVVAADAKDIPIGFAMFSEVDACGYIEEMDVLPSHAGRRIGAALIDEIGRRSEARGLSALLLSTFRDVPWNAPYYRRLGFETIEDKAVSLAMARIRRDHMARGLDEKNRVFMRRPIAR